MSTTIQKCWRKSILIGEPMESMNEPFLQDDDQVI